MKGGYRLIGTIVVDIRMLVFELWNSLGFRSNGFFVKMRLSIGDLNGEF